MTLRTPVTRCNFSANGKLLVASLAIADALLARHAIFPPKRNGEERLRDEPKERLRGRLDSW